MTWVKAGPARQSMDHPLDPPEFPAHGKYTPLEELWEVAAAIASLANAKGTVKKLGCKQKQSLVGR
jgi:hypothetical protein